MTNFVKFSDFTQAASNDATTQYVGLASGVNIRAPKTVTWTTSTRPSPPFNGVIGLNTDTVQYEFWSSSLSQWIPLASTEDLLSTYVLRTPDATLPNSFALSTLSTGILKSTTATGVISISAPLTSIDSLTAISNQILYTTSTNVYATTSLSTFSRGLLADANASAWRTDLGIPGIPVTVAEGGTGDMSFTPYSVICGGTSSTGALQNVSGLGTVGQVLTSNGGGLLPTWQTIGASGSVNPGTVNNMAWYASTGSTISALPTANNGVLVTSNSGAPSIGSTIPLAVQLNITELGTISTGVWNGSLIALSFGGTNANLTASNGGIVYSNATQLQILAGTATAGQMLQSGASSAPSWSTATFPSGGGSSGQILRSNGTNWVASTSTFADTYSNSSVLYANGINTVQGLAPTNSAVLVSNSAGVPTWSSTMTNGQLIVGSTGSTPVATTLTGGTGVTISIAAGSITISATASGLTWTTIAGTSQAANVDSGYVVGNAAQTTITTPATAPLGSVVEVQGLGAAGWILKANTSQTIKIGNTTTTSAGTLTSTNAQDNCSIVCIVPNTTWQVQWTNSAGLTVA